MPRTASAAAAGALLAAGCSRGDRVAFALGSSADLICAALGAARIGLIPVMLNATWTSTERDDLAADARPSIRVFTQAELHELREGHPTDLAPYPLTRPMHYTSGATGRPKGRHHGTVGRRHGQAVVEDEAAVWHFDRKDLHMVCSPMYHTVSMRFAAAHSWRAARWSSSAASMPPLPSRPCDATGPPRPSWCRRICSAFWQPDLEADEAFDSLRLLAHAGAPCPTRSSGRHGASADRRRLGVLRLHRGPIHGVLPRRTGSTAPAPVGRALPGPRASASHPVPRRRRRRRRRRQSPCTSAGPSGARARLRPLQLLGEPEATAAAWNGSAVHRR